MRTIVVVARKGGSGKTTVAVNLAIAAHLAGRHARLLDSDSQGSAVEVFGQREEPGPDCRATVPVNLMRAQFDALAEGINTLIIDTPAGSEESMSIGLVLADLALLVVRPTFLDLTAAVQTAAVLKRMRKPALILLNQAPVARDGIEPPAVRKALEALHLIGLPVMPVILRARAGYQTAIANGRSAMEAGAHAAASELTQAWDYIESVLFPVCQLPAAEGGKAARANMLGPATIEKLTWAEHSIDFGAAHGAGSKARERLVIQNWKGKSDFVTLGDIEVELEPGQEVTLWVRRGHPGPCHITSEAGDLPALSILAEDEALIA